MEVLVLGGSNFIGYHVVSEAVRRGHQVTTLSRGLTRTDLPPHVERLYCDREDIDALKKTIGRRGFDAVFDTSAITVQLLHPSVNLLEGRVGHYIFTSTTAVYASSEELPIDEEFPLDYGTKIQYARDKLACEELLREWGRKRDFPFTLLRSPMVFGPRNTHLERETQIMARLRANVPIYIPGNGLCLLHHVYVEDLAVAHAISLDHKESIGEAYNIAGPTIVTLYGYVSTIAKVLEIDPNFSFMPEALVGDMDRPWYFPFDWKRSSIYSIEKARFRLGYQPRFPLADGMRKTYQWYLHENLDEYPWDFRISDRLPN